MSNSLSKVHPELISEWSDKNYPLTPDNITFGSNKIVWWKCSLVHVVKISSTSLVRKLFNNNLSVSMFIDPICSNF